ncbi:hypothetical protein V6N11_071541 [Hibiscus sabdariffa]|uniref:Uncharacterized protein n=1 Tax=Hibiscus sabdariffa TaxID=183260 RepID=A0ABR2U0Y0_9ROSI
MEVGDFFIGGYYGGALTSDFSPENRMSVLHSRGFKGSRHCRSPLDLNRSGRYHSRHRPLCIHHWKSSQNCFSYRKSSLPRR